jgi:hypothetical protein
MWALSGGLAYFHAKKRDEVKFNIHRSIPFIKDHWFYDSLLNGLRAFYFEFIYKCREKKRGGCRPEG